MKSGNFIPELWSTQFNQMMKSGTASYRQIDDMSAFNRPIGKAWKPTTPEDEEIDALLHIAGVTAVPVPAARGLPARWRLQLTRSGFNYHGDPRNLMSVSDWRQAISDLLNAYQVRGDWSFDTKTGERLR